MPTVFWKRISNGDEHNLLSCWFRDERDVVQFHTLPHFIRRNMNTTPTKEEPEYCSTCNNIRDKVRQYFCSIKNIEKKQEEQKTKINECIMIASDLD